MVETIEITATELPPSAHELSQNNVDAVLLVYDVTSPSSFEQMAMVHDWVQALAAKSTDIKEGSAIPVCLVGNKSDLAAERRVPHSDGAALARGLDVMFFEISARDKSSVDGVFHTAIRLLERTNGSSSCPEPPLTKEHESLGMLERIAKGLGDLSRT